MEAHGKLIAVIGDEVRHAQPYLVGTHSARERLLSLTLRLRSDARVNQTGHGHWVPAGRRWPQDGGEVQFLGGEAR
jgi:hypothetical protein